MVLYSGKIIREINEKEENKMKKFTKAVAIIAMLAMALTFVGCTTSPATTPATTPATKTPATSVAPATGATPTSDKKVLKMATNAYFQPYEYYDGTEMVGIDVEIAKAIAEKMGYELVISDIEFDSIITEVTEGKVDFGMAGMTITDERLESVDFTISYASGVQAIIVKDGSPITSADDLSNEDYKIGVQKGTTGDTYACDDFNTDDKIRVTQYATGNEAMLALKKGDIDCIIIDNEPAKALSAANEGTKVLDSTYADEDYAICVKKGNNELLDKLNAAILELTQDGTIANIVAKYIK